MRIKGGYLPKIAGRPVNEVENIPLPPRLVVDSNRQGEAYTLCVKDGERVEKGEFLAERTVAGGAVYLPAPAAGTVMLQESGEKGDSIILDTLDEPSMSAPHRQITDVARASGQSLRTAIAEAGIWPMIWSSAMGGMPDLDVGERPRAIVVNCVVAQPFKTRGKVLLERAWSDIVKGIRLLARLLADYGTIDIVLTHHRHTVAKMMYMDLAGHAWVHFHPVPLKYPVENPHVLCKALRREKSWNKADVVWTIDVQAVQSIGESLSAGIRLSRRTIAVGGPGCERPRHLNVPVGTPLSEVAELAGRQKNSLMLRGGVIDGEPVDPATDSVGYDDNGFFFLPRAQEREFMSFLRAGFDRSSYIPCFASALTGGPDSNITNTLRGERRPCIACGLCERVCPIGILPQVIHRHLYADAIDNAESMGVMHCAGCGICTYVCPSKIELSSQFREAGEQIEQEHREVAAAEEEQRKRQESKETENERSEDRRK